MEEAEQLIQKLYDPAHSKQADQIQAQLQEIQRSKFGWELAEELLNNQDQNVRFFGALTYTVKLNQEGSALKQNDLLAILDRLLTWLIRFVERGESSLVIRKIYSTLVALFVLPNSPCTMCIRQVVCSLLAGQSIPEASLESYPITETLAPKLSLSQFSIMLAFSNTLATDGARVDHDSPKFYSTHQRIGANVEDSAVLIRHGFTDPRMSVGEYQDMVLQCFQVWVHYTKLQFSQSSQQWQSLQGLLDTAAQSLFSEKTFPAAASFFIDVLADFGEFLSQESIRFFYKLFDGPWAQSLLLKLSTDDFDEDVSLFGQLALSFGQRVSESITDATSQSEKLMALLHQITRSQGYENIDQNLSNAIVDFWDVFVLQASSVAEEEIELNGSFETLSATVTARNHCLSAIQELVNAIVLPVDDKSFVKLGSDHPFSEFRFRVSDVTGAAYDFTGSDVIHLLVTNALEASANVNVATDREFMKTFAKLEASFYCIGTIPHSASYDPQSAENTSLRTLFDSPICSAVFEPHSMAPVKLQKRLMRVIGQYHQFFGHHPPYLIKVLELLFQCLERPNLMEEAAWVVFRLCNRNRQVLTSRLHQFLDASDKFFKFPSASAESKQNMAGAVSSIIQSIAAESDKVVPLSTLLGQIERDYTAMVESAGDDQETRRNTVEKALNELKRIAEGFRELEDETIDLESTVDQTNANFWVTGEGAQTQMQIVHFLQLLVGPYSGDGAILEEICDILKAGYKETKPGPFVFPPNITVDLLTSIDLNNPRFDISLQTAAAFVSSQASARYRDEQAAASLLRFALAVIRQLQTPEKDPDIAYHTVDLVSRFIPNHLALFHSTMTLDDTAAIFSFSIRCLETPTPLPKQSASHLWKTIIDHTSPPSPTAIPAPPDTRNLPDLLVEHLGPQLARAIVFGIGGSAARSELDVLVEPLRKLVFKQPQQLVKSWLDAALFAAEFPGRRAEDAAKRQFCAQVLGLRGARKTNSVVREFALVCRGLTVGYG